MIRKQYVSRSLSDGFIRVSDPSLDRENDRVFSSGIDLEPWTRAGKPLVAAHDYSRLENIIGRAGDVRLSSEGLDIKPKWRDAYGPQDPMSVWRPMLDNREIRAFSIGFLPLDWTENEYGARDYLRVELLEVSAVVVPANRMATMGLKGYNRLMRRYRQQRIDELWVSVMGGLAEYVLSSEVR